MEEDTKRACARASAISVSMAVRLKVRATQTLGDAVRFQRAAAFYSAHDDRYRTVPYVQS